MKKFYLLRHEDEHENSGNGVVAEGIIFNSGMCAMTWLTPYSTITIFDKVTTVKKLHGHGGKTEVVIEGKHKRFEECKEIARQKKNEGKKKNESKNKPGRT